MKKLLGIVVLGLLWCNVGTAKSIELNNCFSFKKFTKVERDKLIQDPKWTKENYEKWNSYIHYKKNKGKKPKRISKYNQSELQNILSEETEIKKVYEKNLYTINFEAGTITHLLVKTNDYQEDLFKWLMKYNRAKGPGTKKIYIKRYDIISYADTLVQARNIFEEETVYREITLDLNNFTYYSSSHYKYDNPDSYPKIYSGDIQTKTQGVCQNLSDTDSNEDNSGASGTAFFINNKGHLLTNNHVVEGCTLSKISYKNKDYDTKLIATDKTLDLALLKAEIRPNIFFNFSKDEAKKLSKVYVAGYPLGKGLSDDLKISSGIVSSLKGFEDNSNEIQIDAPINPGNSGGPIINENGDLVAIAVSGLAKDLTEGINFGIKASAAERFLISNKINPKKSMYSGIKDNDKLLEILEEGTVYTYCN
tara:strand:- start:70 stop:1332 length:1263 start_codon:yes stop_codon:yes gene_type:complete